MQTTRIWKRYFIPCGLSLLISSLAPFSVKAQQQYQANYFCEGDLPNGSAEITGTRWWSSNAYGNREKFKGEMEQNGETFLVETSGNEGHIGGFPVTILFSSVSRMEIWTKKGISVDKLGTLRCTTN